MTTSPIDDYIHEVDHHLVPPVMARDQPGQHPGQRFHIRISSPDACGIPPGEVQRPSQMTAKLDRFHAAWNAPRREKPHRIKETGLPGQPRPRLRQPGGVIFAPSPARSRMNGRQGSGPPWPWRRPCAPAFPARPSPRHGQAPERGSGTEKGRDAPAPRPSESISVNRPGPYRGAILAARPTPASRPQRVAAPPPNQAETCGPTSCQPS